MAFRDFQKPGSIRTWQVLILSMLSAVGLGMLVGDRLVPAMIQLSLGG